MFESYSVGAIFRIVDESGPTLAQIERRLTAIDALAGSVQKNMQAAAAVRFSGASSSLAGLERRMTGAAARTDTLKTAFADAMSSIDAGLLMATIRAKDLAAALGEVAAGTRAMGSAGRGAAGAGAAAGGLAGGRGRGGFSAFMWGRGGGHANASGGSGPLHGRVGVGPGAAAAVMTGLGVYEAAKLDQEIARAQIVLQGRAGDPATAAQIRAAILGTYQKTGVGLGDVEESAMRAARISAGLSLEQRLTLMPTAMMFGAQEHLITGIPAEAGTESAIGLAHLFRTYDPAKLGAMLPKVAALSSLTQMPLPQIARSMGYLAPVIGTGIGVSDEQLMLLSTALARAGVTSTRSGTWLREAITKSIKGTFTLTRHGSQAQMGGLAALGLIGRDGRSTVIDRGGHLDFLKELAIIGHARETMKPAAFLSSIRNTFGARGAGAISVLSDPTVMKQMPAVMEYMRQFPGAEAMFTNLGDVSSWQKASTTLADFNVALMNLGETVLPAATAAIKGLDTALRGITALFGGKDRAPAPTIGSVASSAGVGAAAGAFFGGPLGALIGGGIGASTAVAPAISDADREAARERAAQGYVANFATGQLDRVQVNVGPITVGPDAGNGHDWIDTVIAKIRDELNSAFAHNIGPGTTPGASPYTSGAGP